MVGEPQVVTWPLTFSVQPVSLEHPQPAICADVRKQNAVVELKLPVFPLPDGAQLMSFGDAHGSGPCPHV